MPVHLMEPQLRIAVELTRVGRSRSEALLPTRATALGAPREFLGVAAR